jgi:hypothetical protein
MLLSSKPSSWYVHGLEIGTTAHANELYLQLLKGFVGTGVLFLGKA